MIAGPVVSGLIAIVVAYLLGSIPTAYIVTRRLTGKDIRRLGSGNVGANNTYREVGKRAGAFVGVFDFLKAILAVVAAHWLVGEPFLQPDFFVLGAGVAVIAGQMWPVFLGFRGGNGLGASLGVVAALLPFEFLVAVGLMAVFATVTRNLVLAASLSLLLLPVATLVLEEDWHYTVFLLVIIVLMAVNFVPTARKASAEAGSIEKLLGQLFRRRSA